ncbi:hypothetical protein NDU88_004609 [Pleurodeles waltl]|uniref:Uncharacterized protein n=1 Tax=Pleurodeles waltl TaxID=8319 RepID=A0AAV7KYW4_PLEWA|nr:hypothetical protein NDU88_004609 [Pleurodeles waltl]
MQGLGFSVFVYLELYVCVFPVGKTLEWSSELFVFSFYICFLARSPPCLIPLRAVVRTCFLVGAISFRSASCWERCRPPVVRCRPYRRPVRGKAKFPRVRSGPHSGPSSDFGRSVLEFSGLCSARAQLIPRCAPLVRAAVPFLSAPEGELASVPKRESQILLASIAVQYGSPGVRLRLCGRVRPGAVGILPRSSTVVFS